MAKEKEAQAAPLTAPAVPRSTQVLLLVEIKGLPPGLLQHRFSEKKRRQMLEAQKRTKAVPKEPRDPEGDYDRAKYLLREPFNGTIYGHPCTGFKSAITDAGHRFTSEFKNKTPVLRGAIFINGLPSKEVVDGLLVPIMGEPQMHEGFVRNATGVVDLRFRPVFEEWAATLEVLVEPDVVELAQVVQLIQRAGQSIGVGEGRTEKCCMDMGRWEVTDVKLGE